MSGEFASRIEHTVLGPETTIDDVEEVMRVAAEEGMRACIPPCYLVSVRHQFPDVEISTVVGFPHGQNRPQAKVDEAKGCVVAGADEIDVVANVGWLKSGRLEVYRQGIESVVHCVDVPVKVIIETPLLDEEEKRMACQAAKEAGADFVKTATGFSDGGATVADVELMSEYLPVKASGGIGSGEEAMAMFEAGAERIGASSGDVIVRSLE